jgi:cytochrome c553
MKASIIIFVFISILFVSCGKKEDNQTSNQQQNLPPGSVPQTMQQQKDVSANDEGTKKTDDKNTDTKKSNTDKTVQNQKDSINKLTTSTGSNPDGTPNKVNDIDFSVLFSKKCAKCHGRDGHGKPNGAPNLTSDNIRSKSDKQLFNSISNGIKNDDPDGDDMPAWKGKLTDDEINAAIKYIRSIP